MERADEQHLVSGLLRKSPVVALLGPRQVGKSTLAKFVADAWPAGVHRFDLEDPADVARLESPRLALEKLKGLVVLDEVQLRPDIFPTLRVLADRPRSGARFLVLGSASPTLLRQTSETLAGRIAFHELSGFDLGEVGTQNLNRLWLRGGFPRSYLAGSNRDSFRWRRDFVRTFVQRDLPALGVGVSSATMERFWTMLAHAHADTWNASELARSFGVSDLTVRKYLDVLTATMVVRQLRPFHENLNKRQVKAPKVYVADTGLLHALLGIGELRDLERHPKLGASWEGFIIGEVARVLSLRGDEMFFWGTYSGAEIDLVAVQGRKRRGFEVKRTDAPKVTPSMRVALADLRLERIDVIHAGSAAFQMDERIFAVPASDLRRLARSSRSQPK